MKQKYYITKIELTLFILSAILGILAGLYFTGILEESESSAIEHTSIHPPEPIKN